MIAISGSLLLIGSFVTLYSNHTTLGLRLWLLGFLLLCATLVIPSPPSWLGSHRKPLFKILSPVVILILLLPWTRTAHKVMAQAAAHWVLFRTVPAQVNLYWGQPVRYQPKLLLDYPELLLATPVGGVQWADWLNNYELIGKPPALWFSMFKTMALVDLSGPLASLIVLTILLRYEALLFLQRQAQAAEVRCGQQIDKLTKFRFVFLASFALSGIVLELYGAFIQPGVNAWVEAASWSVINHGYFSQHELTNMVTAQSAIYYPLTTLLWVGGKQPLTNALFAERWHLALLAVIVPCGVLLCATCAGLCRSYGILRRSGPFLWLLNSLEILRSLPSVLTIAVPCLCSPFVYAAATHQAFLLDILRSDPSEVPEQLQVMPVLGSIIYVCSLKFNQTIIAIAIGVFMLCGFWVARHSKRWFMIA